MVLVRTKNIPMLASMMRRKLPLVIGIITVALLAVAKLDLFTSSATADATAGEVSYSVTSYKEGSSPTEANLLEHIIRALVGCGEVCDHDIRKPLLASPVLPTFQKKVDCESLMTNAAIDASRPPDVPIPRNIPQRLYRYYTYDGKVAVKDWFINVSPSYSGGKARMAVWTEEQVEDWKDKCIKGTLKGTYGVSVTQVRP